MTAHARFPDGSIESSEPSLIDVDSPGPQNFVFDLQTFHLNSFEITPRLPQVKHNITACFVVIVLVSKHVFFIAYCFFQKYLCSFVLCLLMIMSLNYCPCPFSCLYPYFQSKFKMYVILKIHFR